jgi:phosphopantothenoylcysteine decarboxylase/phosphopantothenate--cysteine ligase
VRPFAGRRVLLGVTGGIASYKAAWVARLLAQHGAEVDVVMTRAATEFVGPVTVEALTGRRVYTELIAPGHALDHIRLARAAELVIVAPATADFLARAVHGHADDLLSACLLATSAPVLLVPAMNDRMWAHPQVARNVAHAREIGYRVLEPAEGPLAAGEGSGPGRMPEPETIVIHAGRLLEAAGPLAGRRIVVTAGPTREPVDPVRYLTNHSSGKMGVALAAAAWRRGAEVTLVAGPLQPTPDILASTRAQRRPGAVVVGFALETTDVDANARRKLAAKELDLVVLNDATEAGAGFGVDTNRVTLYAREGAPEALPLMPKGDVADAILDRVAALVAARAGGPAGR